MVMIDTKDVGDVQDKFDKSVGCVSGLEEANEVYIKKELGL